MNKLPFANCLLSEIIKWSSANNSVSKINSLEYLLVISFFNQILMTSSKHKLNKTGDSGQPCLTPWVMTLESSDIPLLLTYSMEQSPS
jgi:hypothetical protein